MSDAFWESDLRPVLAHSASDADYINALIRDLEDPDKRLVTEKLHDWRNYGVQGKAAILAALKYAVVMRAVQQNVPLPRITSSDQVAGQ